MKRRHLRKMLACSFSIAVAGATIVPQQTTAQVADKTHNTVKSGKLKGRVINADGHAAADITINLKGTPNGAFTEEDGSFSLKATPGVYTLVISAVGIQAEEHEVSINQSGITDLGTIKLNASAQQLSEAVVKGSKRKYKVDNVSNSLRIQTPLLETPQNIQVVTAKVLADQQAFDMLESVTRNVSGATRLEHWDTYALINMRGSQVAAFRNGMNVQMPWGPLSEDMSFVDRIEFVKGPAGFMMSNGEPSGFYNIVTKKPTGETKGEVNFTAGSYNTFRSTLDLDGKLSKDGKLLYRLNLMGQTKGSFRPYEYNNRYTVAPVLMYKFNDKTSVTAEYTYQYSKMSMIGSAYVFSPKGYGDLPRDFTTMEPNLDPTIIKDHSAFATLNHQINDNWKFTAQLAYLKFDQTGSSMWPWSVDSAGNMVRGVNLWDAEGQNKLGQFFVNGTVHTGSVNHKILAGLDMGNKEYMADWGQGFALNAAGDVPFNIYNPVHGNIPTDSIPQFDRSRSLRERAAKSGEIISESYTGVYLQDEIGFLQDKVRLTLAGRYTSARQEQIGYGADQKADDQKFTPRVGVSVSIDNSTSVYALYDQSFVQQFGIIWGGSAAKPLTGNNIEAGIKKDWFGGRWNTTLAAYQIIKNNVLTSDPDTSHKPMNIYSIQVGQTKTKGIEFDLRGEITRGLSLVLNYSYTDSKVTKDAVEANVGAIVPGFAKHMTNGWLSYRFREGALKGIGLSLGYQYQIDRSTWVWSATTQGKLPDYFRMDGGISWQNNKFSIALNVNNLLDAYLYSGAPYGSYYYWQAEAPRNFRLNIGYKF
ncbi:TonB-dependent siderophore receptor [Chitinophagaceae bacterium MMS25-I14]